MQIDKLISEQPVESNICFPYLLTLTKPTKDLLILEPTKVTYILCYCFNDEQVLTFLVMNFSFNWQTSMVGLPFVQATLIVKHQCNAALPD